MKELIMKKKDTVSKPKEEKKESVEDSLRKELDVLKKSHNDLVEYLTAKDQAEKRVIENNPENNTVIPQDERSEGIMDKKVGAASLGDIVTIAKAYLEQSRMEQQAPSQDSFFADVGKSAFTQWFESSFGKNMKINQNNSGVQ